MNDQTISILETRLGEQLAEIIAKRGGKPLRAPALAEVADVDPRYIATLLEDWQAQPAWAAIFQTGVGTHALFKTTDALGLSATLFGLTRIHQRGRARAQADRRARSTAAQAWTSARGARCGHVEAPVSNRELVSNTPNPCL
ncbi:MAG: hypothetical protein EXR28_12170 [Betaproteobacteria bacterium]|nr:hypothetical protein [Betaproteobacteria bacterium]